MPTSTPPDWFQTKGCFFVHNFPPLDVQVRALRIKEYFYNQRQTTRQRKRKRIHGKKRGKGRATRRTCSETKLLEDALSTSLAYDDVHTGPDSILESLADPTMESEDIQTEPVRLEVMGDQPRSMACTSKGSIQTHTDDSEIDPAATFRAFQHRLEEGRYSDWVNGLNEAAVSADDSGAQPGKPIVLEALEDDPSLYEMEKGNYDYQLQGPGEEERNQHLQDVRAQLERLAEEADFCTESQKKALRDVLLERQEAFALEQRFCSMNKLEPITCELKEGHPSIYEASRPLRPVHREFLKEKLRALESMKMLKCELNPLYAGRRYEATQPMDETHSF